MEWDMNHHSDTGATVFRNNKANAEHSQYHQSRGIFSPKNAEKTDATGRVFVLWDVFLIHSLNKNLASFLSRIMFSIVFYSIVIYSL